MSALYYVLGYIAKLNAGMWRYRINFLPSNVLVIAVMAVFGYGALDDAVESMHNATTPLPVSVAQIRDEPNPTQQYVAVTGVQFPFAVYQYGSKDANGDITRVDKSWAPLLDRQSHRVLLVQRPGKVPGGTAHEATVTGMLRELNADVRQRLGAHNDMIDSVPVETRYTLVADEHPANSITSSLLAVLLWGLVALFLTASLKRNTIFRRADLGSRLSKLRSAEPLKVGATGTFLLDQSGKTTEKRFIDMPAVLTHLESGSPALLSNIDASSHFMGIKTADRSGIWAMAMEAGSVRNPEVGYLYWGTSRRPALRFAYKATGRGATRQAIVTANDISALDTAVALLTTTPTPRDTHRFADAEHDKE